MDHLHRVSFLHNTTRMKSYFRTDFFPKPHRNFGEGRNRFFFFNTQKRSENADMAIVRLHIESIRERLKRIISNNNKSESEYIGKFK